MAQAEFHEVVAVDRDKLFATISKYEDYPSFVDGVKSIQVERPSPGKARVHYKVSMMKEVEYSIDLTEDAAAGTVRWTMIESDSFKKNNGSWELKAVGPGKTDVKYQLEIEFNFPVPGMILNRLVKGSLPSMVKSFANQANKRG